MLGRASKPALMSITSAYASLSGQLFLTGILLRGKRSYTLVLSMHCVALF